jgi:hypothetical protein
MTADAKDFEHLVRELAQLPAVDRARVVAEASRRAKTLPRNWAFCRPTLTGGISWVGGSLSREELYGEHGR